MKVCIYTNHFFPEDFKVNDIAFELAKKGFEITVITAIPDYPKGKYFDGYSLTKRRKEIINGVKVIRLPIIPRGKGGGKRLILNYISYYFCCSIFTFFHSITHKYDKVFVHLTSPFFVGNCARYIAKKQHIPLLFWVLDLWPESLISAGGITNPLIIKSQIKMVQKVYKQCDKILVSSKGFEKSICEKGDFKDKLIYFPNWAEEITGECPKDFDITKIPPFDNQKEEDFIILFAGNIGEAQNLDVVISAAEILKDKENIKFVFVGDGRKREFLLKLIQKKKLQNTVFFPGRYSIQTMPIFMKKASILLFSLKDEFCFNLTVPAKTQFYMSQRKPILAVVNGEGAEVIKEARCGIAVNAGNFEELAKKIILFSSMSVTELNNMAKNGYNYYLKYYSKNKLIQFLYNLLK